MAAIENDKKPEQDKNGEKIPVEAAPQETSGEACSIESPEVQTIRALEEKLQMAEERIRAFELKVRDYVQLQKKLSEYETKISDIREYVKKMEKEVEQIRDRSQKEIQKNADKTISDVLLSLLNVVDDFDRSVKSIQEEGPFFQGLQMIHQRIHLVLKQIGLEKIESVKVSFDPTLHEAVGLVSVQDPGQEGKVMEEIKAGYKFKDFVLRPAHVLVGKKEEADS